MKVSDILQFKGDSVHTVLSWNTVPEAAARLAGPPAIGALVVSDDGFRERVDGIVSERDIVRRFASDGAGLVKLTVADIMTRHVITCSPDDSIAEVMATMNRWRHRHLPVVENGKLCGLISIGDVVKQRLAEMSTEAGVLRDIYLASH
ncbi:CBS domain-containing protein [Pseudonocardia sp. C8]|uniref:CBS domain-containing protein n=1 Tax=Pseudonocardia sp. C8 TaxID=2762759 RepID=UPI001642867E|nr:CBS domain-containing protein [Pseudonocardia sp. C8]MBC3192929.1 CBS domain-containing protein [Pseudonocardia sp. C8]